MKKIRKNKWQSFCSFLLGVCVVIVPCHLIVSRIEFPDYAKWTGIRPLEKKLKILKAFAQEGDIDALIIGSSIPDHGFQAEEFSRLMTHHLGRPYRAFNFSTGGAEISFFPTLYRLARMIAKPKLVLAVIPPGANRADGIRENAPDFFIKKAEVAPVLSNPYLLKMSHWMWSLPLIANAAALRDLIINRKFANFTSEGADLYQVSYYGDRINYTFASKKTRQEVLQYRSIFEDQLKTPPQKGFDLSFYYPKIDVRSMEELKRLVMKDDGELQIVAHSHTSTCLGYVSRNKVYVESREKYVSSMAEHFGVKSFSVLKKFTTGPVQIADTVHFNYFGALTFTRMLFSKVTQQEIADFKIDSAPDLDLIPNDDPLYNTFSAVVFRENPEQGKKLSLKLVQYKYSVPALPKTPLWIALRTPENKDIIAEATRVDDYTVEANFESLPVGLNQAFISRILQKNDSKLYPIYSPIAEQKWSVSSLSK